MAKEIEVVVNPDGSVSIEALGFEGKACEDATRELEKLLGDELESKRKAEYYRTPQQRVKQGA
jgi:hypothetical protein